MTRDELWEEFLKSCPDARQPFSNPANYYIGYLEDQLLNIYNNLEDDGK